MDSPKILIACDVRGDTRRYRSLHLVEQFGLIGINCKFVHLAEVNVKKITETKWTFAVFQRAAYGKRINFLLENLMREGTVILSDFDDLVFDASVVKYINSPDFADSIRIRLYKQNMENIYQLFNRTEGSLASTDYLAAQIQKAGKPAFVHRNAFSLEMLRCSEEARIKNNGDQNKIVIGYGSGTPTHNKDFELIKPVLLDILKKYSQVELRLVGPLDPGEGWGTYASRLIGMKLVNWRRLPEVLATFDINLAPLVMDNPFAQSKSEIKWMEAAMVEVPTIASPTDAFRYAIRQGENGLLAYDLDEWKEGLSSMIEDASLRKRLGQQAYRDVQRDYHPVRRAVQLVNTLNNVSQTFRGQSFLKNEFSNEVDIHSRIQEQKQSIEWVPAQYELEPNHFVQGLFTLRNHGFMTFVLSIWIYFRRLVSPIIPFR